MPGGIHSAIAMKRKLIWLIVACFMVQLLLPLGALGAAGQSFTIGSLVTVARYITGQITLPPEQLAAYDLDGSGDVNILDLVRMAQVLTGSPLPDVPAGDLTDAEIIERALAEVPGADRNHITHLNREMENGRLICDVEIRYNGFEYDFEIQAADGSFLKWSCEQIADPVPGSGDIGLEQAAALALARIQGAAYGDILSIKEDTENNAKVYEGVIRHDGRIYEFEIAAADGAFLKWSWERISPEATVPTTRPTQSPSEGTQAPTVRPSGSVSPLPTGNPSGPALTREEAQQVVLSYIPGATAANFTEFKQDTENGIAVYEGKVRYDNTQYEFIIAASDGTRLAWSWERRPQAGVPGVDIGIDAAKNLALAEVPNARETDITKAERTTEDGIPVYEIKIWCSETEYEFEIVAATGVFCKQSFERKPYLPVPMPTINPDASASATQRPQATAAPAAAITPERAKEIALAQVPGATSMNIIQCRLDRKENVYEVEIRYSGVEYEFEIDAASGAVVKQETDRLPTSPAGNLIAPDAARQLILDRVPGATVSCFREFGIDYEHGRTIYEGELCYNGIEYEFKLDAQTGQFLEWEVD